MVDSMEKTFGTLVRHLRLQKGDSLRGFAREVGLSANFVSNMERGKTPPPGEDKIVRMAEYLGQNHDEMLALAGKISADILHIILQKPKETADLLLRLSHAPAGRLKAYREALSAPASLEFYPLATISHENHTAAELAERPEMQSLSKDIGLLWLRRLLRRGRKYRMKVFAVAQEFEVNAWKIAGEGGLRRAFTVLYLGSTAYQAIFLIKDKPYRERLRAYFDSVPYPCLVDVKGRFFPAEIPDLSGFS
jgi:transcriptional regulator with XRE-family HTH domain